jgi:hypothetical protein
MNDLFAPFDSVYDAMYPSEEEMADYDNFVLMMAQLEYDLWEEKTYGHIWDEADEMMEEEMIEEEMYCDASDISIEDLERDTAIDIAIENKHMCEAAEKEEQYWDEMRRKELEELQEKLDDME